MVTRVGAQDDFAKALQELVELDYDAVEAYKAAINRLENSLYKSKLTEFKEDHQRHIVELSDILKIHKEEVPESPSLKQWLTKGKVLIGGLAGDNAILKAMQSNEEDTNDAYERMNAHRGIWEDAITTLRRGLEDERKHKAWIESVLR